MKINYPEEYNIIPNIIIPNYILNNFLQSNWIYKNEKQKIEAMELLIKELELQMGLKTHYPIQITSLSNTTSAAFGIIDSVNKTYGIMINKNDLKDNSQIGISLFNSICHEMKHAEQKEIELGLIRPHSKEEYQKILENSSDMDKAYYCGDNSFLLKHQFLLKFKLFEEQSCDKGLRYILPYGIYTDLRTLLYRFQYVEREAYKFADNLTNQLKQYIMNNNLTKDLKYINGYIETNNFKALTKNLMLHFGDCFKNKQLPNFDYHKVMENIVDLMLHTIDTRMCPNEEILYEISPEINPDKVCKKIWEHINYMSKETFASCYMNSGVINTLAQRMYDSNISNEQAPSLEEVLSFIGLDDSQILSDINGQENESSKESNLTNSYENSENSLLYNSSTTEEQNDDLEL